MLIRAFVGSVLAASVAVASGCGFFRDAEISEMVPGGNLHTAHLECWLEITFTGEPPGDPRDVEVIFSSVAMPGPQKFDWGFIAENDVIRKGDWAGYKANVDTSADSSPPIGTAIRVKFPLQAYERFRLETGEALELHATLYWGGEKQHTRSRNLGHVFTREGSAL